MDYLYSFLLIILILFLVILLIRVIRFIINFLRCLYLAYKYRAKYDKETRKILANKYSLPEEPRNKDLEAELQFKEDMKKLHASQELVKASERTIVGIAEPIGMWTKFVTGQKLSWLKAMVGSKAESDKFWQNIVAAQEQAQGKSKGRMR